MLLPPRGLNKEKGPVSLLLSAFSSGLPGNKLLLSKAGWAAAVLPPAAGIWPLNMESELPSRHAIGTIDFP